EKLNMNLTAQLEQTREMAAKSLSEIQLKDNIFLRCDIKKLNFNDVIVQKDKIMIQVYSEGESTVFFK
ncbi:MAG: DUF4403 family protein, partial [Desulfuromonadaceae bacterium]|nr:DUF4403 family protein [Desulfuromonadaceae bacterium]